MRQRIVPVAVLKAKGHRPIFRRTLYLAGEEEVFADKEGEKNWNCRGNDQAEAPAAEELVRVAARIAEAEGEPADREKCRDHDSQAQRLDEGAGFIRVEGRDVRDFLRASQRHDGREGEAGHGTFLAKKRDKGQRAREDDVSDGDDRDQLHREGEEPRLF
jgi:hypothetical protein